MPKVVWGARGWFFSASLASSGGIIIDCSVFEIKKLI